MRSWRQIAVCVAAAALLGAIDGGRSFGDPLPASIETLETMMEVIAADGEFLGRQFGPEPDNPLSFTANLDADNRSFTYSFDPGTTFAGRSLSLSGSGSFDAENNRWTGTSNGELNPVWHIDWRLVVIDDPYPGDRKFDWETTILGVKIDVHRMIRMWETGEYMGESIATLAFTINDEVVAEGTATDCWYDYGKKYDPPEGYEPGDWFEWSWRTQEVTTPEGAKVRVTGMYDTNTGVVTGQVVCVPEPATLLLLGLGLAGMMLFRRRQ